MQEIAQDTLVRVQRGDVAAFEEVYKASAGFVYNVSLRILGHKEDAEEVTQDVFVTVFKKIKDFRFESSFKTWVYRITFNAALNYSRKGFGMKKHMVAYDDALVQHREEPEEIEEKLDTEQRKVIVKQLLAAVGPTQRACLILREMEGLSYQEIAQVLKVNINTVRSRLKRAREQLLSIGKKVDYAGV